MAVYPNCYNSTGSRCSGGPQKGTLALRDVVLAIYTLLGSLGIYNCRPSSGGGGLSTHGEGRGWDCRCNAFDAAQKKAGDELAALLVKHHNLLGIQRIIWNRRQTDVRNGMGNWRPYSGQSPHTDHLHIELCWASAAGPKVLTEKYVWMVLKGGMELTPDQEKKLDDLLGKVDKLLDSVGERYDRGPSIQKALVKYVDHDADPATPKDPVEHLNVIDDKLDTLIGLANNGGG